MQIQNLIIGGGIAGISVAVSLGEQGADYRLLESSSRLGGKIESVKTPEALFEYGPNSFTNQTDAVFDLLKILGLEGEVVTASTASHHRYILKKGQMVRLPRGPQGLLTTQSLSLPAKIRFFSEALYVRKKKKPEESVRDFFLRHFGREVADYFADPFVSGIYAGDASRLSLSEAFPTMAEAERASGSLIRHLIRERKTAKATPQSYQLREGLESIFHRALKKIGTERVHLNATVVEIIPEGKKLRVTTNKSEYVTDHLFLTAPAYVGGKLLQKHFPDIAGPLSQIEYAPVVTAHLVVPRSEKFDFNGFGILLPSSEKRNILGALWNSSIFPELFPDKKHHYLTVYVGGVRNPSIVEAETSVIERTIVEETVQLFGLREEPKILPLRRHQKAIPQYTLEYSKVRKEIETALVRYPALKLTGNYWGGTSIPKTIASAMKLVEEDASTFELLSRT